MDGTSNDEKQNVFSLLGLVTTKMNRKALFLLWNQQADSQMETSKHKKNRFQGWFLRFIS